MPASPVDSEEAQRGRAKLPGAGTGRSLVRLQGAAPTGDVGSADELAAPESPRPGIYRNEAGLAPGPALLSTPGITSPKS